MVHIESIQNLGFTFCEEGLFKKIQFWFKIIRYIGILISTQIGG